jgi:BASS family bile acid:Na+ symporter
MESQLIQNLVALSLLSLMFSLGLNQTFGEITSLWRQPSLFLRSFLSVVVLAPIVAIIAALPLPVGSALRGVLLAMAAAPGAPLTTKRAVMAGASLSYAASLQITVSILAVITVPFWGFIYNAIFPATIISDPVAVLKALLTVQVLPIGAGVLIRQALPDMANKIEPSVTKIANILFVALILVLLVGTFHLLIGVGALPFMVGIPVVAIWLVIGHYLGGPNLEERSALAVGTIARNVGMALLLIQINIPAERMPEILPVLLAFVLVGAVGGVVYTVLLKKSTQSLGESVDGRVET